MSLAQKQASPERKNAKQLSLIGTLRVNAPKDALKKIFDPELLRVDQSLNKNGHKKINKGQ